MNDTENDQAGRSEFLLEFDGLFSFILFFPLIDPVDR